MKKAINTVTMTHIMVKAASIRADKIMNLVLKSLE